MKYLPHPDMTTYYEDWAPAHAGDAGFDLYARETTYCWSHTPTLLSLGVSIELPYWQVGLLTLRSSATRYGVIQANTPGIIDSGYRGELRLQLLPSGTTDMPVIPAGTKIAQLVIVCYSANATQVNHLSDTSRGHNGFGSTG